MIFIYYILILKLIIINKLKLLIYQPINHLKLNFNINKCKICLVLYTLYFIDNIF